MVSGSTPRPYKQMNWFSTWSWWSEWKSQMQLCHEGALDKQVSSARTLIKICEVRDDCYQNPGKHVLFIYYILRRTSSCKNQGIPGWIFGKLATLDVADTNCISVDSLCGFLWTLMDLCNIFWGGRELAWTVFAPLSSQSYGLRTLPDNLSELLQLNWWNSG